jgi:hypothetical protein
VAPHDARDGHARSGRLAVRTTVAGQLALDGFDATGVERDPACAGVTHVVTGITVGAYELLSGGKLAASGGGAALGVGAGASLASSERVMRSAGAADSCSQASDGAPTSQCSSPIQIFVQPVTVSPAASPRSAPAPTAGVEVAFPAPPDRGEHWSLHDADGARLCDLPCARVVPPGSGYYLERLTLGGNDPARVELPPRMPYPNGSRVTAAYEAERGSPLWSKLAFYGVGLPGAALSIFTLAEGIHASSSDDPNDKSLAGFWYGATGLYLGVAAATFYWFEYSHAASFDVQPAGADVARRAPSSKLVLLPGGVAGTF